MQGLVENEWVTGGALEPQVHVAPRQGRLDRGQHAVVGGGLEGVEEDGVAGVRSGLALRPLIHVRWSCIIFKKGAGSENKAGFWCATQGQVDEREAMTQPDTLRMYVCVCVCVMCVLSALSLPDLNTPNHTAPHEIHTNASNPRTRRSSEACRMSGIAMQGALVTPSSSTSVRAPPRPPPPASSPPAEMARHPRFTLATRPPSVVASGTQI